MKWRDLNQKQREVIAEKFADLGNIAVGSLVFGVVLRSDILNRNSLILGVLIYLTAYWISLRALR
jgi:hypothetical protein